MTAVIETEPPTKDSRGRKGNTKMKNTGKDTWVWLLCDSNLDFCNQTNLCLHSNPATY